MSSISQNVALLGQAMDLRTQRHQMLASNIANADTPHYKARDFSFEEAMKNSMAGRAEAGGLPLSTTASGHLQGSGLSGPAALKFRSETQSAVDGNTVDMDVERSHIAENALQYQIVSQLISEKFKGMRSALSSTQG